MAETFNEDPVRVKLAGQEIPISESYSVRSGVLEVPAQFEITVGHGGMFAQLATLYPSETPFELWVGDKLVQVGETDGYALSGGDGTTMTITGRDSLRRLHDTEILDEKTFAEKTFTELTKTALKECGLGDRTLLALNAANRKAITGKDSVELEKKRDVVNLTEASIPDGDKTVIEVSRTIKGEVGVTWLEFLTTQYRRAGLFLWSDHSGNFILSQPDGGQRPLNRIVRRRGSNFNEVSVVGNPSFSTTTTPRYSECIVVGRAGGGKHGRGAILDRYIDDEMVAILNRDPADRKDGGKRRKPLIIRDHHVRTPEQAKFLSRRKIAEGRRAGWRLNYTVSGHSAPAIGGGRSVWQPDTTVEVIDDELGIEGVMYVEGVTFSRRTDTVTELHLMRIDDLVYAEEPADAAKGRPKLKQKPGVVPQFGQVVLTAYTQTGQARSVWQMNPNGDFEETDISRPIDLTRPQ